MNQALLLRWIKALRSTKYVQGKGIMYDSAAKTWCCLGVLCDVAKKSWTAEYQDSVLFSNGKRPLITMGILPSVLAKEFFGDAKLTSGPMFTIVQGTRTTRKSAVELNDVLKFKFPEIGTLVEEQYLPKAA